MHMRSYEYDYTYIHGHRPTHGVPHMYDICMYMDTCMHSNGVYSACLFFQNPYRQEHQKEVVDKSTTFGNPKSLQHPSDYVSQGDTPASFLRARSVAIGSVL